MKKRILLILIFILILTLAGCKKPPETFDDVIAEPKEILPICEMTPAPASAEEEETQTPAETEITDISQCIISDEDGRWLLLPQSRYTVRIRDSLYPYVNEIDLALLKQAETTILQKARAYHQDPLSLISLEADYENKLTLYIELIVPADSPDENLECGDHKHVTFREYIVK